ncbi:Hypothetical predicted protein [Mytilus galloprovincialis]|uniref:Uncharacterized protein n=1 Tax=Mytilus galloprovincialis TaxID=29158 RepID=A0A8B6DIG1_MYTGA|nr:Hypothetical predicted protein [Mytilus galloprovincialis]
MASFTSLVMLFCVMINVIYVDATVKMLNDKTCDVREDPISYIPNEYNCKFLGAGLYIFEEGSPSTVRKLTMDRLTDLSFLNIPQGTGLEMWANKGPYECEDMGSRETLCGSYLSAPKFAVHPLPSTASSSGTDNTFVSVVEMTTDDHEEITKPDQTTEISKPSSHSSEKTTMKTANSSQQYGSTPQHNVSSEPTGIDSENVRIYMCVFIS